MFSEDFQFIYIKAVNLIIHYEFYVYHRPGEIPLSYIITIAEFLFLVRAQILIKHRVVGALMKSFVTFATQVGFNHFPKRLQLLKIYFK